MSRMMQFSKNKERKIDLYKQLWLYSNRFYVVKIKAQSKN